MTNHAVKKLYIHIGYPKTATSALQQGLYQNYTALPAHDFCYPLSGIMGVGKHSIAEVIQTQRPVSKNNPAVQKLLREMHSTPAKNIILSSERFASYAADAIADVKHVFKDFDIYIVVYLRRQDVFLQSWWSQTAKTGRQRNSFEHWVTAMFDALAQSGHGDASEAVPGFSKFTPDYHYILSLWSQAFGKDHILVRPFERAQLHPNILVDLLQTCGMSDTSWVPEAAQVNVTPSLKTTEVLRSLGVKMRPDSTREDRNTIHQVAFSMMRDEAERLGWNKVKPNYITPDLYARIMARFEEGNHAIAQTYLGRNELFTEPFTEKPVTSFSLDDVPGTEILDLMQPALQKMMRRVNRHEASRNTLPRRVIRQIVRTVRSVGR